MIAVMELKGVSKTYGAPPGVEALKSVDLTIRQGELVAIVGPSGSGKSTLLHIIGTLDRPTSGSVWVAGQNLAGMSDSRLSALRGKNIGFVFQQFFLLEGMTALENVAAGLVYQGIPSGQRTSRAHEALERVGMAKRRDHRPSQLSGGERQRVAIARAVAGNPSIVLADEPTGNLDSVTGRDILRLLQNLNREGATIAIITHDREMAAELPRRVELRDGRIIFDGETRHGKEAQR